ncbi:sensor histidine kinase, partial [Streptomyces sp. NPDC051940]|uniref:sensor histidine kinase n=1 Tax=Streptomyces sp. NPDC051940 TaxID=3155675 RepID=UPI0034345A43
RRPRLRHGLRLRHLGLTYRPRRVSGWEPGLRSTLNNLLTNAAVHGATDGTPSRITVTVRPDPARDAAVLTVDDEGPGIAPEERARVFDRFRHRPGSPGSGLGLTLVAQQTALHGGTVEVTPPPSGCGARFVLTLPLDGPADPSVRRDWLARDPDSPVPAQDSHKNASYAPRRPSRGG